MNRPLKTNLASLPDNIWVGIFSYCDSLDKLRFQLVCRTWFTTISTTRPTTHDSQLQSMLKEVKKTISEHPYYDDACRYFHASGHELMDRIIRPISSSLFSYTCVAANPDSQKPQRENVPINIDWILRPNFNEVALVAAAQRGDVEECKFISADLNHIDPHFGTPLYTACYFGNLEVAEFLTSQGADVNVIGGSYGSPLQSAAYRGHPSLVKLLLSKKANINAVSGYYGTALQAAVHQGHSGIVDILLSHSPAADINSIGGQYGSALVAAVFGRHTKLSDELIRRGAHVEAVDRLYPSPLVAACRIADLAMVELLFQNGAKANEKAFSTYPLSQSVLYGPPEIVKLLIEEGARAIVKTQRGPRFRGLSAIQVATHDGNLELVKFLLKNDATFCNDSPLEAAVQSGNQDIIDYFLANARTPDFISGLRAAIDYNSPFTVKKIVFAFREYQSTRETRSSRLGIVLTTALNAAVSIGDIEITRLLLGDKEDWADEELRPAFEISCSKGHNEIARLLLKHGASVKTRSLYNAIVNRHEDTVQLLIRSGATANDTILIGTDNMSILRIGALSNSTPILKLLLKAGADIDKDAPIEAAASNGNKDMIHMLVSSGADVNRTYLSYNALLSARAKGFQQTAERLVYYGAEAPGNFDDCLEAAISRLDLVTAEWALGEGARPKVRDYWYNAAMVKLIMHYTSDQECLERCLCAAVEHRDILVVEKLLKRVNNVKELNLLETASKAGPRIIGLLLSAGCYKGQLDALRLAGRGRNNYDSIKLLANGLAKADLVETRDKWCSSWYPENRPPLVAIINQWRDDTGGEQELGEELTNALSLWERCSRWTLWKVRRMLRITRKWEPPKGPWMDSQAEVDFAYDSDDDIL